MQPPVNERQFNNQNQEKVSNQLTQDSASAGAAGAEKIKPMDPSDTTGASVEETEADGNQTTILHSGTEEIQDSEIFLPGQTPSYLNRKNRDIEGDVTVMDESSMDRSLEAQSGLENCVPY